MSRWRAVAHHSMRAYYLPIAAGALLIVSAFLPWVRIGDEPLDGIRHFAGLWVAGLGGLAIVLASLSIWTRLNSRHPLLLVGLMALGVMFLAYRFSERAAAERAWAAAQAVAIVDQSGAAVFPETQRCAGIYLGLAASAVLVAFGMTIVVTTIAKPYADPGERD